MKGVETGTISTGTVSSMITDSIAMIDVECPPLPQGVGPTHLDSRMIDASTVAGEEFKSTPGNQALMQDPSSFKVWSTGTELTERATTEMYLPAAKCTRLRTRVLQQSHQGHGDSSQLQVGDWSQQIQR